MTDETAVAETEPSIDDLIAEFDAATPEPPPDPETAAVPAPDKGDPADDDIVKAIGETLQWAAERQQAEAEAAVNADIDNAVKFVVEGAGVGNERIVRGLLYSEYYSNPQFQQAFNARDVAPDILQSHLRRMTREVRSEYESRPDPDATADRDAVLSGIKAAASGPVREENDEISHSKARKMTDEQLEEYLSKY